MATEVYNRKFIYLIDGTEIEIVPLKIKYLREFMDAFENIKNEKDDDGAISVLTECTRIAMKQYYPSISKTVDDIEENLKLASVYEVDPLYDGNIDNTVVSEDE